MSQGVKVFFACAIGGFLGSLAALEVSRNFWWIGLLVGFAAGYLSYELKKVIAAVPIAWRAATSWRPDKRYWGNLFKLLPASIGILWTYGSAVMIFPSVLSFAHGDQRHAKMLFGEIFPLWCLAVVPAAFFMTATLAYDADTEWQRQRMLKHNPFRVLFWLLPKCIVLGMVFLVRGTFWLFVKGVPAFCRFIKHLFLLVHSDIRLLCGVDAAIGAAVGYFTGHAPVGMLAGGLIGVLNFEVVSKRVLKLVPAKR